MTGTEHTHTLEAAWIRLGRVAALRKYILILIAGAALSLAPWFSSAWSDTGWVNEGLEWAGLVLMLTAIIGRCTCVLYLGKRTGISMVPNGPYSVTRNPLPGFTLLATFGAGLQTASLFFGFTLTFVTFLVIWWGVHEEERLLSIAYGREFAAYCARVPRFLPRLSNWHSPQHVSIDPSELWASLREWLPLLLAIPLFEGIEALQKIGWFQVRILLF